MVINVVINSSKKGGSKVERGDQIQRGDQIKVERGDQRGDQVQRGDQIKVQRGDQRGEHNSGQKVSAVWCITRLMVI